MRVFFKLIALISVLSLSGQATAGQTADFEDIYLMGTAGWRNGGSLQLSAGGGYVFTEGFGLGALYDYSRLRPFGGLELRWFLEPFESAIAFGMEHRDVGGKMEFAPMFTLCGDYLFSVTPSLALRATVKWLLPLSTRSGVFTGAGFRVLF